MERERKVLIIGEVQNGHPAPVTLELIGEGKRIASCLNARLLLTIMGNGIGEICSTLLKYPIDRIIAMDHPRLGEKQINTHGKALEAVIREHKPDIILGGATLFGRSLLPSLAAIFGTDLMTDACGLDIERTTGKLLVTKPAYDGKRMSVISMTEAAIQIAMAKPGVFQKPVEIDSGKAKITMVAADWLDDIEEQKRFIEIRADGRKKVRLEDANIIAAGGRGLKGPEGFELLKQFAEKIGAQAGCTRPCVDTGWMLPEQQIGQTGSITKPDVYLAFGISGAIQHMTGVRAKTVIAVNSNPNAAIFKYCDYGIVGDAKKILEEFLKLQV